jgi:hypothetical protein
MSCHLILATGLFFLPALVNAMTTKSDQADTRAQKRGAVAGATAPIFFVGIAFLSSYLPNRAVRVTPKVRGSGSDTKYPNLPVRKLPVVRREASTGSSSRTFLIQNATL